jgi:hypothetical protein
MFDVRKRRKKERVCYQLGDPALYTMTQKAGKDWGRSSR